MDLTGISAMNPMTLQTVRPAGGAIQSKYNQLTGTEGDTTESQKLLEAAQDFESFFIYMLLKEMRKTVNETPLFHGGRAEEIFRDMMDEEVAKQMAQAPGQGLGIAKMMYDQLSRSAISNVTPAAQAAPAVAEE